MELKDLIKTTGGLSLSGALLAFIIFGIFIGTGPIGTAIAVGVGAAVGAMVGIGVIKNPFDKFITTKTNPTTANASQHVADSSAEQRSPTMPPASSETNQPTSTPNASPAPSVGENPNTKQHNDNDRNGEGGATKA